MSHINYSKISGVIWVFLLINQCTGNPQQPAPQQQEPEGGGFPGRPQGGLIDVDVHDTAYGGKHVGVHVPVFYQMDLDKDPYGGRKGLGINVLEGLVKVRVKKDPYRIKDNVFVSLAGIPLWMQ